MSKIEKKTPINKKILHNKNDVLKIRGVIKINSISYNNKKNKDRIVFINIFTLKVLTVLKPHSYCVLVCLFGTCLFVKKPIKLSNHNKEETINILGIKINTWTPFKKN